MTRPGALLLLPVWIMVAHLAARGVAHVPWFAAPAIMLGGIAAMFLIQGLLERYIRRRARLISAEQRSELRVRYPSADERVISTPRSHLVLIFLMVGVVTGLVSWQASLAERGRQARQEQQLRQAEQLKALREDLQRLEGR